MVTVGSVVRVLAGTDSLVGSVGSTRREVGLRIRCPVRGPSALSAAFWRERALQDFSIGSVSRVGWLQGPVSTSGYLPYWDSLV